MGALKFRVLLDTEEETEIFRDILINEDDTFESLYQTIISSFRFQGDQMASFYMSNDDWDKGHEISLMDMTYGDESLEEKTSLMYSSVLSHYMKDKDQKIILVYDFMRMWIFLIELLERNDLRIQRPEVVFSVGIAPPEDSKMMDINEEQEDEYIEDDDFDNHDPYGDDFEDGYNEEDYQKYDDY